MFWENVNAIGERQWQRKVGLLRYTFNEKMKCGPANVEASMKRCCGSDKRPWSRTGIWAQISIGTTGGRQERLLKMWNKKNYGNFIMEGRWSQYPFILDS